MLYQLSYARKFWLRFVRKLREDRIKESFADLRESRRDRLQRTVSADAPYPLYRL
jgi:hypothetical protein